MPPSPYSMLALGHAAYEEDEYAQGLRIAGVRHVLMSLWQLGDASAREFMRRFYEHWLAGTKPQALAVALRQTPLSFIQDNEARWREPRVWAPYVLVEMQP